MPKSEARIPDGVRASPVVSGVVRRVEAVSQMEVEGKKL